MLIVDAVKGKLR